MPINSLGAMIDCSRGGVYTLPTLKKFFSYLSRMGYTYVQLYTEDVYEVDGEPYFGYLRGRYSKQDLKELDAAAKGYGLELVPCIQTLAHLRGLTRWAEYVGVTDTGDILLADDERTYALIEKMFSACAECFSSRRINIGMDEAHMVGLGKYLDRYGFCDRFQILLRHLARVVGIAERYGFSPMMWSDMFFRLAGGGEYRAGEIPQEVRDLVPERLTLIYWDYYSTNEAHYQKMLRAHREFPVPVAFAGGASCWYGFAPLNRFALRATEAAVRACLAEGVGELFITCWKDDGAECPLFASLPVLYAAAQFARGNFDMASVAAGFEEMSGVSWETFLAMDGVNVGAGEALSNPSRYMLYSDPFLGIFDRTITACGTDFSAVFAQLSKGTRSRAFGYMFRTLCALCRVLEMKMPLGVRTRKVCRSGDEAALRALIADYAELEKRLKIFYRHFSAQWERECRGNGFEHHDVRLGGLMQRVRHCRAMLSDVLSGKTERIAELGEDILPFADNADGAPVLYTDWLHTALIKPLL